MIDNSLNQQNRQDNDFLTVFNGKFYGVLRWNQLEELWRVVKKDNERGWYIYAIGEPLPTHKTTGESVNTYVDELNKLLRREHDEEYCGVVYTDSFKEPRLIKVFDPNNLGTSCSIATQGPLPSWIFTKMMPEELLNQTKQTENRRHWWKAIFRK